MLTADSGLELVDFERVCIGAAEWDLAKLWDVDLATSERRDRFAAAYRTVAGLAAFPDAVLLDVVRLVCAWRSIAHAARYGAPKLQELGERVTAALHDELAAR